MNQVLKCLVSANPNLRSVSQNIGLKDGHVTLTRPL